MKRSRKVMLVLLTLAVLISAIAVVHSKYRSRLLFRELKKLDAEIDEVDIEWEQLLLEQGAWRTPMQIEASARKQLNMRMPRADEIVIIKEQHGG